jgi:hypothetical protein
MAAKFKMVTETKFAYKNYNSSFFEKKLRAVFIEKKFQIFNMEIFLASFSRGSHIRLEY